MQAPLDDSLIAATTGVWSFSRGFGAIWGVTIPSAIFNNKCRENASSLVTDPALLHALTGGRAYEFATKAFLDSIEDPNSRRQVVRVFQNVSNGVTGYQDESCQLICCSLYIRSGSSV